MSTPLENPDNWKVPPAHLAEALGDADLTSSAEAVTALVSRDDAMAARFAQAMAMQNGHIAHAFLAAGIAHDYLGLDVIAGVQDEALRHRLLSAVVLSRSVLMPLDLRGAALAQLVADGADSEELLHRWRAEASPLAPLPELDRLRRDSDGVDHVFDVPEGGREFSELLVGAAERFQQDRVDRVLARAATKTDPAAFSDALGEVVASHIEVPTLSAEDYLVPWDVPLAEDDAGSPITVAELAKALLLHPAMRLPGRQIRAATVGFYRSVLGICGRSVVGIGAGFLYVEHGSVADPSYVYVGQGAIIGKGVTLDTVGGVVLGRESFLGGGFLPLLVHTHKHLRKAGEAAAAERLRISKTGFVAEAGARYPLGAMGLFECADYVGKPSPYPGIRVVPISK